MSLCLPKRTSRKGREAEFEGEMERTSETAQAQDRIEQETGDPQETGPACSPAMKEYFTRLQTALDQAYELAERARAQGFDPETRVEIPQAEDVAARVEKLVGPVGVAGKIRELLKTKSREEAALRISMEVAREYKDQSVEKALDQAIRTGLALLTEGVLVAPLEGVTKVEIMANHDGSSGPAVHFAGPIRSAGGTGQAMSLLIADAVRQELGLGAFIATEEEVERYKEEVALYSRDVSLQLTPSNDEVEALIRSCPICITGDGSGKGEVSGYRDLERMGTNNVRTGACLVIAEGLYLKAAKLKKHIRALDIEGWDFLDEFSPFATKKKDDGSGSRVEIKPSGKYLKDIIAGRPVFSHPSRKGGFNLHYGRARNTGLAAAVIHPATMALVDEFLALGTQMKIERPGKAGAIGACDSITPPLALLKNGDLVELCTIKEVQEYRTRIKKIVDLGDILLPFGEFVENNHPLMPACYSEEWWQRELEEAVDDQEELSRLKLEEPSPREAFGISERYSVPLHPSYNLLWHDISIRDIEKLKEFIFNNGKYADDILSFPVDDELKDILVELGALHTLREGRLIIHQRYSYPLVRCLGLMDRFLPDELRVAAGAKAEEAG